MLLAQNNEPQTEILDFLSLFLLANYLGDLGQINETQCDVISSFVKIERKCQNHKDFLGIRCSHGGEIAWQSLRDPMHSVCVLIL